MEKPRMDRRFPWIRSGLLNGIGLFLCLLGQMLHAQTDEEAVQVADPKIQGLKIETHISPEIPVLNSLWIVSILVDHPVPTEVTVKHPAIPTTLSLESIRTGSRMIGTSSGESRRWTAVEFCFIPQVPGRLTLNPFEVITPDTRLVTKAITVSIPGTFKEYRPYFSWVNPPRSLTIGKQDALVLRLINWDPRKPRPNHDIFRQHVPEQMILEEQPLSDQDREQEIMLRLAVIPLEGAQFILKPIHFQHEGVMLEIPGITIPVISAHTTETKQLTLDTLSESLLPASVLEQSPSVPLFPETSAAVFPLFQKDYEQSVGKIRDLWNTGQIPEALAELRRNEREHAAGPYFVSLREQAERSLDITLTHDEPWRPRKFFLLLFVVSLGLLSLIASLRIRLHIRLSKENTVTSRFSHGYKDISMALILVTALVIGFWHGVLNHAQNRETGVLRAATAYRIPEGSGISAYFSEGQPVIIRSASDDWVYVESFDGRIGWVSRDKVIVY